MTKKAKGKWLRGKGRSVCWREEEGQERRGWVDLHLLLGEWAEGPSFSRPRLRLTMTMPLPLFVPKVTPLLTLLRMSQPLGLF